MTFGAKYKQIKGYKLHQKTFKYVCKHYNSIQLQGNVNLYILGLSIPHIARDSSMQSLGWKAFSNHQVIIFNVIYTEKNHWKSNLIKLIPSSKVEVN